MELVVEERVQVTVHLLSYHCLWTLISAVVALSVSRCMRCAATLFSAATSSLPWADLWSVLIQPSSHLYSISSASSAPPPTTHLQPPVPFGGSTQWPQDPVKIKWKQRPPPPPLVPPSDTVTSHPVTRACVCLCVSVWSDLYHAGDPPDIWGQLVQLGPEALSPIWKMLIFSLAV